MVYNKIYICDNPILPWTSDRIIMDDCATHYPVAPPKKPQKNQQLKN